MDTSWLLHTRATETYADNKERWHHKRPEDMIPCGQPTWLWISIILTTSSCQGNRHNKSGKTYNSWKQVIVSSGVYTRSWIPVFVIKSDLWMYCGDAVASWLVRSSPDQAVRVQALARDIMLWSFGRHFTLTVPLSTQGRVVRKPVNVNWVINFSCLKMFFTL